ncbi:hypothetical protein ACFWPV_05005 [Streptomyces uncialis]|uniref:hypothetical protein n=1 Tax=Streptomyces uncialis TaxID=1048205 RepID=UPI003646804B
MTVGELINRLSELDRDAAARLAFNPFFPMAHRIADVVTATDETGRPVVFLADGQQLGHLPPAVAVRLTWQEPTTAPPRTRRRAARPSGGDR